MGESASDLARRLAERAEAVCRHYLSNGRRVGGYWLVGDVDNSTGRSLFVRLTSAPARPAGKWTDAATGEHGDLLDLIAANRRLATLAETLDEARLFLSLPERSSRPASGRVRDRGEAARRLFAMSRPVAGTLAARYLRSRGIARVLGWSAIRFWPAPMG